MSRLDLPDGTYLSESKVCHSLPASICEGKVPVAISSTSAGGAQIENNEHCIEVFKT